MIFTKMIYRMSKTKWTKTQISKISWMTLAVNRELIVKTFRKLDLMEEALPLEICKYLNIICLQGLTQEDHQWKMGRWFKNICQLWIINDLINFQVTRQLPQAKSLKDAVSCYSQELIYKKAQHSQCKQVFNNQIILNYQKVCRSILSSIISPVNNVQM